MSTLRVTNLKGGSAGSAPNLPDGAVITGVATVGVLSATTFYGSGANLTGIDATALKDSGGTVKVQANSTGAVVTGVLTATTGSFTGNISVGGTLTYEDVTNVDSVGMVTARNGVKVLAGGINAVGVVTATSFAGSGANLTGIDAAPTVTGTASGTIAAHKAVIVKSDGKIGVVEGASAGKSSTNDSVWFSVSGTWPKDVSIAVTPDGTKAAVIYQESSSPYHSFLRIGTTSINGSSSTITWGTAVQVTADGGGNNWKISEANTEQHLINIDNTRFLLLYSNVTGGLTSACTAKLFSVSGTTATFGSEYTLNGGSNTTQHDMCQITGTNKVFAVFRQASNSYIKAQILDCGSTGLTVTGGSPVSDANAVEYPTPAWDSTNNQGFIGFRHNGEFWGVPVAVSGTTVTFGSWANIPTGPANMNSHKPAMAYNSVENRLVAAFESNDTNTRLLVGTCGSNSLSWNSNEMTTMHLNYYGWKMAYDASVNKISMVFLKESSSSYQTWETYVTINSDGVTAAFIDPVRLNVTQGGQDQDRGLCIVPTTAGGLTLYAFARSNSSPAQGVVVFQQLDASNADTGNFLGFSDAAYTDGQTVKVKVVGNITTQSGLTPGKKYYIQNDGTIGVTAATPNIPCGKALTSTQLLVDYS